MLSLKLPQLLRVHQVPRVRAQPTTILLPRRGCSRVFSSSGANSFCATGDFLCPQRTKRCPLAWAV